MKDRSTKRRTTSETNQRLWLRRTPVHYSLRRGGAVVGVMLALTACNGGLTQGATEGTAATATRAALQTEAAALPTDKTNALVSTDTPLPPTPTETAIPQPLVYPLGPSGFPADVDPLTGLRVSDPNLLNRRPLAVKVSNFPRTARPQFGLSKADILWEFYTEYGNTRFIAMYYGQDADKVGPIRSARIMDTRIVPLYDAILVHVQAFEAVWDVISLTGVSSINEFPASCPAICRDASVEVKENSAFANTTELTKYAKTVGLLAGGAPNLDGMVFNPAPPTGGSASIGLWIKYSSAAIAEWKYDSASNRYLRFSEKDATETTLIPLVDAGTGNQLAVDNVILVMAPIHRYNPDKQTSGELWDVDLTQSGKALFFRDGVMVEGKWQSTGGHSPLQFVDSTGQPLPLKPGSSYVGIINMYADGGSTASTEWMYYDFH